MLTETKHPVDGVPRVRTNVSPVCDVGEEDQCGVLISQTVLKAFATYITNELVQLKLENTCADIEDEAVEVSPVLNTTHHLFQLKSLEY